MAQSSPASTLREGISVPSNIDFTMPPIPPDGQTVTINFSNVEVSIGPVGQNLAGIFNQTAIQTKVVTLHIPYSTDQLSVTMRMALDGLVVPVEAETGAEARLVVCAGDTTKVVDLSRRDEGFFEHFEFTVHPSAAKPKCQITLFLLVEHDTDIPESGAVNLVVESLNLEIVTPSTGTYKV